MKETQGDEAPNGGHRINPIARFAVERRVTMGMIVLGVMVLGLGVAHAVAVGVLPGLLVLEGLGPRQLPVVLPR